MTFEHLSETQLTEYRERALSPRELLAVDSHLASCDECHARLSRILPEVGKRESGEEPFHLDYEQHLEPYVDGTANEIDREIVDSHVAVCSTCATELRDLLEFKQQPAATTTWMSSRWKEWLPLPLNPVWAAAAAVLGVVILAGAVVFWTTRSRSLPVHQAETVSPETGKQKEQPSPAMTEQKPQVNLFARGEPLVVLNDAGGEVIVNKRGQLEGLQELPPDLKESVERALTTGRLGSSPALKGWSIGGGSLRGGMEMQNTFAPLAPVDVVIETDRPTFRWRALEGAHYCVVTIYDAKLRQVESSGPVTRAEWTTPKPFERGVTYSWQISAVKDGETVVTPKPPLPEARFRVLDQRAITALAKLKQSAGSSHVAMGVFYWKHGLIAEAEREFQALANANPNSTVANGLLTSIRRH
jgi:hypothetical protein